MNMVNQTSMDDKRVTQYAQSRQEPKWLLEKRLDALSQIEELALPQLEKTNINNWNFTKFDAFKEEEAITALQELPSEFSAFVFDQETANVVVQKNASSVFQQFDPQIADKGVIFSDLHTALREHEELVKSYMMSSKMKRDEHKLAAIHQALFNGGVFLYVPKNVELTIPFQSLFYGQGKDAAILPYIMIVTEENARVEFIANFVADKSDEVAMHNGMIDVFVGSNANVRVSTMNNLNQTAVDVLYRRSYVGRDGQLEWITSELSDGRTISDNTTHLVEDGGTVNVKAVILGAGETRSNITTNIRHWGKHTNSDIHARSVMKDAATNILNSITKIEKDASKSDGQQTGKVLMLNPKARGDANPILLIDENDVTAGHAASVGRVDPLQMYYLMSRGVSKEQAEKLIIYGFLDAVISDIPSEALQKRIHEVIEGKFQS
ncbi:Fe-S cluster assembly protein SufD [Hazenella sp. IB182357]|uniref:Fe-S cluster assembly protein SufD n=1 Tax=Polycladospora coralii TaxID=2771432 RepID=A0A926RVH1_9BACL|nr:Fe-S cluster assembly protein SufD [Polycladospora coralii]MBD1373817.1 Fe-S cluster assembly protein SufD [Polycladospora coralii]